MKLLRRSIFCLAFFLLMLPELHAQDLSRYRTYSLGTTLDSLLKQTGQDVSDVQVSHQHPALMQQLSWWPAASPVNARRPDAVEQMQFSFYSGELYRISIVYDRRAVEGLTDEDMVHFISALYGTATNVAARLDPAPNDRYAIKQRLLASWENSCFSVELLRNSFADGFGLILLSRSINAQALAAVAEAKDLETLDQPQKEADLRKKEAADLELVRKKNKKDFQP